MFISQEFYNTLSLPIDLNLWQLRYLFLAATHNKKHFIVQKIPSYIKNIPDREFSLALKTDIRSFEYNGKIPGFRFENAPIKLHKNYLLRLKGMPPLIFAVIINNNLKIYCERDEYKIICKEFNKIPVNSLTDLNEFQCCTNDKYRILKDKYPTLDVAFCLTLCGILINDDEKILTDLHPETKEMLTVTKYNKFLNENIKAIEELLKNLQEIKNNYNSLFDSIKAVDQQSKFSGYLKLRDEINQLEKRLDVLNIDSIISSGDKNELKVFMDDIYETFQMKEAMNDVITRLQQHSQKIQKNKLNFKVLEDTSNTVYEFRKFFELSIDNLKSLSDTIGSIQVQIKERQESLNNYIDKAHINYDITSVVKINIPNGTVEELNYPTQICEYLQNLKKQQKTLDSALLDDFVRKEIARLEYLVEKSDIDRDPINEVKVEIVKDGADVFSLLERTTDRIGELLNTKKIVDNANEIISFTSHSKSKLLKLLDLLKCSEQIQIYNYNHFKYLFDEVGIEKIENRSEVLILIFLLKKIIPNLNLTIQKLTLVEAKLIILLSYVFKYTSMDEIDDLTTFLVSKIPYAENVRYKLLIDNLRNGNSIKIIEIKDPNESIEEHLSKYFIKQNGTYKHSIVSRPAYKGFNKYIQTNLLPYLEKEIYQKILASNNSKTKLNNIKNTLLKLNLSVVWINSEIPLKLNELKDYQIESLEKDFQTIVKSGLELVDEFINKIVVTKKQYFKEEFHPDINDFVDIFDSKLIKYLDTNKINGLESETGELINNLMNEEEFVNSQVDLVCELYNNDMTLENILGKYLISYEQKNGMDVYNYYSINDVVNNVILSILKGKLDKSDYALLKDKYYDYHKKIKSFESKIEAELKSKFDLVFEAERLGLAEQIYFKSEEIKLFRRDQEKAKSEDLFDKISKRIKLLEDWLKNYIDDTEKFDFLYSVLSEANKLIFKNSTESYSKLENEIYLLEQYKNSEIDFQELEIKISDVEIESSSDTVPNNLVINDISRYLKRVDSIENNGLKEKINKLKNNFNIEELIEAYKKLKLPDIQIQPSVNIRQYSKDVSKDFFNNFSKTFRLYTQAAKEEYCKYYNTPYPFFLTQRYVSETDSNPVIKRKIVLTILNNTKGKFNHNDLNDINGMLRTSLGSNYSPDDYFIICFILHGNAKEIREVYKLQDFDNLTLIDSNALSNLLVASENPSKNLSHLLIKHLSIKTLNPYDTSLEVTSQTGIFVGRQELITKIFKDSNSYALYGARRIGKTSLCLELKHRFEKGGSEVFFSSVSSRSYRYIKNFNEGLSIANNIYSKFSDLQTELHDFQEFQTKLSNILERKRGTQHVIIIDEFDRFIKDTNDYHANNNSINHYIFIKVLRDLKIDNPNLKIILSGFIYLYKVLHSDLPELDSAENPWKGFVTSKQISLLKENESKELINKLEDELALKFENDNIVSYILENTSDHPAYIQEFCKILVNRISSKINNKNRRILKTDIDNVLSEYIDFYDSDSEDLSFIQYVDETTRLNLDEFSRAIIAIFALADYDEMLKDELFNELKNWEIFMTYDKYETSITALVITDVLTENVSKIRFRNKFWKNYLHIVYNANSERFDEEINLARAKSKKA